MKFGIPAMFLVLVSLAVFTSGCVTRRTVTRGGETVSSGYVVKSPFGGN